MNQEILEYSPATWDISYSGLCGVDYSSDEFDAVMKVFDPDDEEYEDFSVYRNQDVERFGQFILGQQLLAISNKSVQYYRVRRYVSVPKRYYGIALSSNLDSRQCDGYKFNFNLSPDFFTKYVFVVVIVTTSPYEVVTPTRKSHYYIEYIVKGY